MRKVSARKQAQQAIEKARRTSRDDFDARFPKRKQSGALLLYRAFGRNGEVIYICIPPWAG